MKGEDINTNWVIFGAGNFIFDIIDAIEANNQSVDSIVLNSPIHSTLKKKITIPTISIEKFKPKSNTHYIFGFLDPCKIPLINYLKSYNLEFANLIHPRAYISKNVSIGMGNYFGPGVIVGPNSKIGSFNYFNRGSLIGHDVVIGSYNHFGPGSIVCGRCKIIDSCNLGAGSVINDGLNICSNCIIGSLAGVTKNITKSGTYVGLPAKRILR